MDCSGEAPWTRLEIGDKSEAPVVDVRASGHRNARGQRELAAIRRTASMNTSISSTVL
jgi:hypothetical protein